MYRGNLWCKGELRTFPLMTGDQAAKLTEYAAISKRILEYGCGGSTLWMAQVCPNSQIHSVEHDPEWARIVGDAYDAMRQALPMGGLRVSCPVSHFDPLYHTDEYVNVASGPFHLVLIDGHHETRAPCMMAAPDKVADKGYVLVHDSKEELYQPGLRHLERCLTRLDDVPGMHGDYDTTLAVFRKGPA